MHTILIFPCPGLAGKNGLHVLQPCRGATLATAGEEGENRTILTSSATAALRIVHLGPAVGFGPLIKVKIYKTSRGSYFCRNGLVKPHAARLQTPYHGFQHPQRPQTRQSLDFGPTTPQPNHSRMIWTWTHVKTAPSFHYLCSMSHGLQGKNKTTIPTGAPVVATQVRDRSDESWLIFFDYFWSRPEREGRRRRPRKADCGLSEELGSEPGNRSSRLSTGPSGPILWHTATGKCQPVIFNRLAIRSQTATHHRRYSAT